MTTDLRNSAHIGHTCASRFVSPQFEQRQKMLGLPVEPDENSVEAILERAKNAPGKALFRL